MSKLFYWLGRLIGAPFRAVRSGASTMSSLLHEEEEDTPILGVIEKAFDRPSDLLVHVNELRRRLTWAIISLVITTGISFAFTPEIIDLLASPIGGMDQLQAIDPTEPIAVFMKVALLCGFSLALPLIFFQLWLFAAPGLSLRTRWFTLLSIPLLAAFFVGGMAFAYFVLLPQALPYMLSFMGIKTVPRPNSYISFVSGLLFWVGVMFEFPFIVFILARIGVLTSSTLARQWRIAIVVIAVLSAVITPTVDPVNMSLLMLPMILLYFLSVFLAYIAQAGRRKAAEASG